MAIRSARLVADTRTELSAALADLRRELGLPDAFPDDVLTEADRAAREVPVDPDTAGLADLRGIPFLTIDPDGSTDLDQALHIERTGAGVVLSYAIADVPAFVAPGGAVDDEARRRGQTVYAPDGRIPLHPPILSEDAASLLPERDRRAYVWRFELDDGARPVTTTLTRGVIRSREQWTYVDAQQAVDDGTAPETLRELVWFGDQRAARESERGGASLNIPEIRIVTTDSGYGLEVDEGVPLEDANAHVSLLTGMAAADIMLRGRIGILRTMPPASDDDVAAFRAQTAALGLPWAAGVPYGDYLRDLPRTPLGRVVREHAASLFRGAGYVAFDGELPELTTQAAIAAPYAHTTAPLRRLVDRWSLVVCEALANGTEVPSWARTSLRELPAAMGRSAQLAGRLDSGAIDRVEAAVLSGREGEEFAGIVLRRRDSEARVALTDPPVETTVADVDVEAGSTIRLRLERTDIGAGRAEFRVV
ncbi:RNB domain-containing ribonuclease [Microbacterium sp. 179-B 1A2 NHS]|uniref:RNB domain-containing ribonuclease n=1 Tax=Microbacterium sp. 179-B 1A2 NHS TaxID=3142383 RepID=UPI0039A055B5